MHTTSQRTIFATFCVWGLIASLAVPAIAQQPILSPRDSALIRFNGKRIFIDYGRPSMRGRAIMGSLVPYTRWWRTGANEATTLMTDVDILIGDSLVPKGEYTLYTLPSAKQWKLIVNRQTGQWGTMYTPELDLFRVGMYTRRLRKPVEKFTIKLEKAGAKNGILHLIWERTDVWVPFRIAPNGSSKVQR